MSELPWRCNLLSVWLICAANVAKFANVEIFFECWSRDCFFLDKFKQTPSFFAWKWLLGQAYDPTSYSRQGGFMQSIEAQCIIKQYALYGRYCFVTCWRVVCYTNPPSLWPSDTVCSARQSSVWLDWLSALSVCFSDLVIFVWWLAFLTGWVLVICWSTVYYESVCFIWDILFCNLLRDSVLCGPTLVRGADDDVLSGWFCVVGIYLYVLLLWWHLSRLTLRLPVQCFSAH